MLYRILALGDAVISKYDTSSLKTVVVAGSALPPALCNRWQDTFGDTLYNLYGSTEVAVATVATPHDLRLSPGSIGKAPISSYLRLYDDNDKQVTAKNVAGRRIRAQRGAVRGIHRRPQQTGHRRVHVDRRYGARR